MVRQRVKNPRVARTRAGNTMTESAFWSFIRSGLRQKFSRWPPKYHVLSKASRKVTGKRHKTEYKCSICKKWFKKAEVEVDHYPEACGSLKSFEDLPRFVRTLFCEEDNLRVACKTCHMAHTKKQRKDNATS